MTKIEELNTELVELQARVKKIQEEIEKTKQAEWPQDGDDYWFIDGEGDIQNDTMYGMVADEERKSIGNTFRTKEEAEFEVERLKVIAELKKFAMSREEVEEARHANEVIYIILTESNEISTLIDYSFRCATMHFKDKCTAHNAVRAVGEDRVKKYYFGVEEQNEEEEEDCR